MLLRSPKDGWIRVKWDHGLKEKYRIGAGGDYDLVVDKEKVVNSKTYGLGLRVRRGPDWHWSYYDQDNNGLGTTVEDGDRDEGWSAVKWDHGVAASYRIGLGQCYDLIIVEEDLSTVRPVAEEVQEKPAARNQLPLPGLSIEMTREAGNAESAEVADQVLRSKTFGLRVQRGPDWNWADQDQHGLGTTIDYADSEGWIGVKWDNGLTNSYRIGKNQCYDLMVVQAEVLRSKTFDLIIMEEEASSRPAGSVASSSEGPGPSDNIQVGSRVKFIQRNENVDYIGCLGGGLSTWVGYSVEVHKIQGASFIPVGWGGFLVPLSAVRLVEEDEAASTSQDPAAGSIRSGVFIPESPPLRVGSIRADFPIWSPSPQDLPSGPWFTRRRYRNLSASLSAARLVAEGAAVSENSALQEPEYGGYEEDWVDVERASALKCLICMEVARDALTHDPWDLC